jgi:hypothetical protein
MQQIKIKFERYTHYFYKPQRQSTEFKAAILTVASFYHNSTSTSSITFNTKNIAFPTINQSATSSAHSPVQLATKASRCRLGALLL